MLQKQKVIVVLPAYNAESTLERTLADVPMDFVDEIILVDDASRDNTVDVARNLGKKLAKPFIVVRHDKNKGYGGNQKTCYKTALERGADIVVMLHPDYQYDPKLIKYFVEFIRDGYFDVMLGSRVRSRWETLAGGMPAYKYIANRALSAWENLVSGQNFSEWHTGMRAYSRKALLSVDFAKFSDDFIFDTEMLFKIVEKRFKVGDIPVPVRYFKEASSINFGRSMRYGILTVWESFKFLGRKIKNFFLKSDAGDNNSDGNMRRSSAVFFLSVVLIFVGAVSLWTLSTKPKLWVDEAKGIEMAKSFYESGKLDIEISPGVFSGVSYVLQSTGYPVTLPLALFFGIFGYGLAEARIYMLLWMILGLYVIFFVGKKFFGTKNALLALFLIATFASFYDNGRTVVGEIPGFLFLVSGMYFWIEKRYFYWTGIFWGLAIVAKPSVYLILVPAMIVVLLLERKGFFKKILKIAVGMFPPAVVWIILVFQGLWSRESLLAIFNFYKNPYGVSIKENMVSNLLNFFHSTTLIYFGILFLAVVLAHYFLKEERLKPIFNFVIIFAILAFVYYLRSPGWLRYIIAGELLILFLIPVSFKIILERTAGYLPRLKGKINPAFFQVSLIFILIAVQTVHLFAGADIFYSDRDIMASSYLNDTFPEKTIGLADSLSLAIFVPREKRYQTLDETVIPVSVFNSLYTNPQIFAKDAKLEVIVVPAGKKIGESDFQSLQKNYKLFSEESGYYIYTIK